MHTESQQMPHNDVDCGNTNKQVMGQQGENGATRGEWGNKGGMGQQGGNGATREEWGNKGGMGQQGGNGATNINKYNKEQVMGQQEANEGREGSGQ